MQVLDRRLAHGELSVEEHGQRRQALQERHHGAHPGPGARGWMGGHMGWRSSTSSNTQVADVVLSAGPGVKTVGSVEFSEAGRYEFYCSVPGHAQGGMRGTIVVSEAG